MKTPQLPYNPAPDGIRAKIWECLRRNREFRQLIFRVGSFDSIPEGVAKQCGEGFWDGPLAQVTFVLHSFPKLRRRLLSDTWPQLPRELRQAIGAMAKQWSLAPIVLKTPERLEGLNSGSSLRDYQKSKARLTNFLGAWDNYHVIGIPKQARDRPQRQELISSVTKFIKTEVGIKVPSQKALRDDIKSGGRLLGTEKNWEVWHFVAHFERAWRNRERAKALAAVWLYEQDTFEAHPEHYFRAGKGLAEANTILTQRREKIDAHLKPIDYGIERIFPKFDVGL